MLVDELDWDDQEVLAALQGFQEAQRKAAYRRMNERVAVRLEQAMKKAFREQGRLFVQGLRKQLRRFFAEGFEGHTEFLNAPLKEALFPSDWLPLWFEVTNKTVRAIAAPIEKTAARSLELGALSKIAEVGMDLKFDLTNPRAVSYLRDYGAAQVTKINEATRDVLKALITQASNEGWSYNRTAEAIIERFNEFTVGKPQEHIDSRAHLVAVTETGNAYAEGNMIVARDLQAAGLELEKSWDTVGDSKVSEGCRGNEAAGWIPLDQAFPSGHQRPLRFPGCRCDLKTRVKKEQL